MATNAPTYSVHELLKTVQTAIDDESQHKPFGQHIWRFPTLDAAFWATRSDIKSLEAFKKLGVSMSEHMLAELLEDLEIYHPVEREILSQVLSSPSTIKFTLLAANNDPEALHPWPQDAGPEPGILASWSIFVGANISTSSGNKGYIRFRPYFDRAFTSLALAASRAVRPLILNAPKKQRVRKVAHSQPTTVRIPFGDISNTVRSPISTSKVAHHAFDAISKQQATPSTPAPRAIVPPPVFSSNSSMSSSPLVLGSVSALALPTSQPRLGVFACALPNVPLPPPQSVFPLPPTPSPHHAATKQRMTLRERIGPRVSGANRTPLGQRRQNNENSPDDQEAAPRPAKRRRTDTQPTPANDKELVLVPSEAASVPVTIEPYSGPFFRLPFKSFGPSSKQQPTALADKYRNMPPMHVDLPGDFASAEAITAAFQFRVVQSVEHRISFQYGTVKSGWA
ncbi:hypothetical protein C8F01DRAFT_1172605 [Mycena amicta]|nr:hypothetical protein C8F01DRAFT_1172605 [Mycena amicta]